MPLEVGLQSRKTMVYLGELFTSTLQSKEILQQYTKINQSD